MSTKVTFHGENKNVFLKIVLVFYISSYFDVRKECLIKMIHSQCGKRNSFLALKCYRNISRHSGIVLCLSALSYSVIIA